MLSFKQYIKENSDLMDDDEKSHAKAVHAALTKDHPKHKWKVETTRHQKGHIIHATSLTHNQDRPFSQKVESSVHKSIKSAMGNTHKHVENDPHEEVPTMNSSWEKK